ncbi:MAG: TIGR01841 family phasin [Gammaproteobacteria bacterium]|nr:TIGR01841 family phasin [Gammaproteobacteria bacterium]
MENNLIAQWESLAKSTVESSKRLEALNLKLAERLLKKQLELASYAVDATNHVVALLGEGKALPEILAEQAKLASDYGKRVVATTKEATDILTSSRTEYRAWFEHGVKAFGEQASNSFEQVRSSLVAIVPSIQVRKAA